MTVGKCGDILPAMATETLPIFTRKQLAENDALRAQAYTQWKRDPASVEDSVAAFLEGYEIGAGQPSRRKADPEFSRYYSEEFTRELTGAFGEAKRSAIAESCED